MMDISKEGGADCPDAGHNLSGIPSKSGFRTRSGGDQNISDGQGAPSAGATQGRFGARVHLAVKVQATRWPHKLIRLSIE
jgi:hypothetical protein